MFKMKTYDQQNIIKILAAARGGPGNIHKSKIITEFEPEQMSSSDMVIMRQRCNVLYHTLMDLKGINSKVYRYGKWSIFLDVELSEVGIRA